MRLLEAGEMYLKTILILSKELPRVHGADVARYLGLSKPAVSRGLARLKVDDYIGVKEENNCLYLTEKGREVAERICERNAVITELFICLGTPPGAAARDACKIEHDISDETLAALKAHAAKMKSK